MHIRKNGTPVLHLRRTDRRRRALAQREQELMRYQLGHFHPFEHKSDKVQQSKLIRAEYDIANLRAKLSQEATA